MKSISKIEDNKAKILNDIKQAVEELNLILAGKLEARDAFDLLDELQDEADIKPKTH